MTRLMVISEIQINLQKISYTFIAMMLIGCAAKKTTDMVDVQPVAYKVTINPKYCHYLDDGIQFVCDKAKFNPLVIDVKGK